MRRAVAAIVILLSMTGVAFAWGPSGHSIVGELAQHRLSAKAQDGVTAILGPGVSLASIGSWADDERARDKKTTRWHFVSIPADQATYDPTRDCVLDPAQGDCLIAAINRELAVVACPTSPIDKRQRALKFLVHFVGDLHQPLHAILEERGGNEVDVTVTTQEGVNGNAPFNTNLHSVWDSTLIDKTTWSWGSYVERIEDGWLATADVAAVNVGTVVDWANETHAIAVQIFGAVPDNIVLDDNYRKANLGTVDQQLGRAGLRLAGLLNKAFDSASCLAP